VWSFIDVGEDGLTPKSNGRQGRKGGFSRPHESEGRGSGEPSLKPAKKGRILPAGSLLRLFAGSARKSTAKPAIETDPPDGYARSDSHLSAFLQLLLCPLRPS
jgi:hypothetical protein